MKCLFSWIKSLRLVDPTIDPSKLTVQSPKTTSFLFSWRSTKSFLCSKRHPPGIPLTCPRHLTLSGPRTITLLRRQAHNLHCKEGEGDSSAVVDPALVVWTDAFTGVDAQRSTVILPKSGQVKRTLEKLPTESEMDHLFSCSCYPFLHSSKILGSNFQLGHGRVNRAWSFDQLRWIYTWSMHKKSQPPFSFLSFLRLRPKRKSWHGRTSDLWLCKKSSKKFLWPPLQGLWEEAKRLVETFSSFPKFLLNSYGLQHLWVPGCYYCCCCLSVSNGARPRAFGEKASWRPSPTHLLHILWFLSWFLPILTKTSLTIRGFLRTKRLPLLAAVLLLFFFFSFFLSLCRSCLSFLSWKSISHMSWRSWRIQWPCFSLDRCLVLVCSV